MGAEWEPCGGALLRRPASRWEASLPSRRKALYTLDGPPIQRRTQQLFEELKMAKSIEGQRLVAKKGRTAGTVQIAEILH